MQEKKSGFTIERLESAADRAIETLQLVRQKRVGELDEKGEIQSTARRLSQQEIAVQLGVNRSKVTRYFDDVEPPEMKRGKSYRHTLLDQFNARIKLGKMPPSLRATITITIANFKGGVSKSTLTAHLSNYLALAGYSVLAVDMDPQGSLSAFFGMNPDYDIGIDDTLVPYFEKKQKTLDYAIRSTELPNLSIIPAAMGLAHADMILPGRMVRESKQGFNYATVLEDGLKSVKDRFDFILIDSPPSLSYLTNMATRACDILLIPLRPNMPDLASSAQFLKTVATTHAELGVAFPDTPMKSWPTVKMIITQGRKQGTSSIVQSDIRWTYPDDLVLPEVFPHKAAIEAAARRFRTIYDVSSDDVDRSMRLDAQAVVDQLCAGLLNEALLVADSIANENGEQQ